MNPTPPPGVDPVEYARWQREHERRAGQRSAKQTPEGMEWKQVLEAIASAPPETPDEIAAREKRLQEFERNERLACFRKICPPEFQAKIDRDQLASQPAFDAVCAWTGTFPGILCHGPTGTAKTRACWSTIGRLMVNEARSLAWFPVKRLITEFARYESKDLADEFWRFYRGFNLLFVDDLDKINWQFESESSALFQFYDWIYRERRPCLTTTNHTRQWWSDKMGDAFARRLFDEAHAPVEFAR